MPAVGAAAIAASLAILVPRTGHANSPGPVPVQITNTSTQPVVTSNTDNGARQPYEKQFNLNPPDGANSAQTTFTVPVGKTLVIESVSTITNYSDFVDVALSFYGQNDNSYDFWIPFTTARGGEMFGNVSANVYALPGTVITVSAVRAGYVGEEGAQVNISGYYVDTP